MSQIGQFEVRQDLSKQQLPHPVVSQALFPRLVEHFACRLHELQAEQQSKAMQMSNLQVSAIAGMIIVLVD